MAVSLSDAGYGCLVSDTDEASSLRITRPLMLFVLHCCRLV